MPDILPAKLAIPLSKDNTFEFTFHSATKIADFEKLVQDELKEVKNFEIVNSEGYETVGDLKMQKFEMKVNGKPFQVYPDLRSMLFTG